MKKLLALVTVGMLAVPGGLVSTISSKDITEKAQNISNQVIQQQWNFSPIKFEKKLIWTWDSWVYFAIDNINLSLMGINTINKLHQYNVIRVSDINIKQSGGDTGDRLVIMGDDWKTNRRIGSEDWYRSYFTPDLNVYTAVTLWNDEETGNLMMRLAYKVTSQSNKNVNISVNTGSKILFL